MHLALSASEGRLLSVRTYGLSNAFRTWMAAITVAVRKVSELVLVHHPLLATLAGDVNRGGMS